MATKTFNLPVHKDEHIRVIYHLPENIDAPDEAEKRSNRPVTEIKWKKIINEFAETLPEKAEKPLIVMLHGFPGVHKGARDNIFGELEQHLGKLGYASVRFDFRGSGESDGREEDFCLENAAADLNAVLQWGMHDAGHRSFVLLGESLGAAIAAIGYKPDLIKGLILLWPMLILNQTHFKSLFTREKMLEGDASDDGHVMFEGHALGKPFINEVYQYDLTSTLEKIQAPVLIQHGTADTVAPVAQAYFGRDTLPGTVDIAIFEGGDHGLTPLNMRHHVFLNIDYFLSHIAKKPAGKN